MTQEQTEGNRLIAEFMGWSKSPYEHLPNKMYKNDKGIHVDQLEYHSSWDWLMPVVEKIENLDCVAEFSINYLNACLFKRTDGTHIDRISHVGNTKIESIYKVVVEFIKWYNQNK